VALIILCTPWLYISNVSRHNYQLASNDTLIVHKPIKVKHKAKKLLKKKYICNLNAQFGQYKAYLTAPNINLVAPVVEGTGDPQLNIAAGHDPSSVWPGQNGTAILQAHDVSFFVNIDRLKPGNIVNYETPCYDYQFVVHDGSVVAAGSPVYDTSNATLALVTCWPTNALYFTNYRYVVDLVEIKRILLKHQPKSPEVKVPYQPPPGVPAPQPLVAQGLTLITNSVPMGLMTIGGRPSPLWIESPGPLNIEASALADYIGAYKALAEGQIGWWKDIAPQLNPPAPFEGNISIEYLSGMNVTAEAVGVNATEAILSTSVAIVGGNDPGRYNLRIVTTIKDHKLFITSWQM
jgi:LPXTG-site transpeptidase (sortase) family protein